MRKGVERALLTCAKELDRLDADWAIGGAAAMTAHGYERATFDVDLFIGDDVREELLERLRPLRVVPTMPPVHYTIIPDAKRPAERVDLLFPALGIESLAVMAAQRVRLFGKTLPVWPLAHIVAHKLVTDPAIDPERATRDAADLQELRDRGLIDEAKVRELLDDVGDRRAQGRLRSLLKGR